MLAFVLGLLAVLAPSVSQDPADAHPFGAPQAVDVSADDDVVRVRWRAGGADDLTVLATALDLVPADRIMLDGAVAPSYGDGTLLARSPAFAAYLLDRILVRRGGAACAGELEPLDHVGAAGVVVDFACARPGTTAEVTVQTMTDLHAAYRTNATGPGGQQAVYTAEDDTHSWSLGDAPSPATGDAAAAAPTRLGRSAALQLGTAGAIALASVAAGLVWIRRRGRRV